MTCLSRLPLDSGLIPPSPLSSMGTATADSIMIKLITMGMIKLITSFGSWGKGALGYRMPAPSSKFLTIFSPVSMSPFPPGNRSLPVKPGPIL